MSTLSSEFCTVQVLVGPQSCISESRKVLRVMQIQSGLRHFVLYNEVSAIENVRYGRFHFISESKNTVSMKI